MKNKITVITPTFNRAHTLERAFESLKAQTLKEFKWIIMDDGSTDETKKLIERLKTESSFEIEYFYHSNRHKFHTVFDGIKMVKTPYFTILDSDDTYPPDALQILFDEAEKIEDQEDFIAVMGLSIDKDGKIVGNRYPGDGFDGSILEMRYKYKIKGDKNGIFISNTYQKILNKFEYSSIPERINAPHKIFFNFYDSKGFKTKFINKGIRIYHQDASDKQSLTNLRSKGENRWGLMLGYLSFLNSYGSQLYSYPTALVRNLAAYQIYAIANKKGFSEIIKDLKYFKLQAILLYPFVFVYTQFQKRLS